MIDKLTKNRFKMRVRICLFTGEFCCDDCRKCQKAIDEMNTIKKE